MAKENSYLTFMDNSWYFDWTIPKRLKSHFKQVRFRCSLNTKDLKQAQFYRNKYLLPVITANSIADILENLSRSIEVTNLDLDRAVSELKIFSGRKTEDQSSLTLIELANQFLEHYKKGNPSLASIKKVSGNIDTAYAIFGKGKIVDDIRKEEVVWFRDVLLSLPVGWQQKAKKEGGFDLTPATENERSMHPNTVKEKITTLKQLFTWGISDCKLNRNDNPALGITIPGSGKQKHKRPPENHEADLLCKMPMPNVKTFDKEAWEYLPKFARYTGARPNEIAVLNAEDIIEKNEIRCLRITNFGENKRLKTESSERVVPVSSKLAPFLDELLARHPHGPLFPNCGNLYDGKKNLVQPAHYLLKTYNRFAKKIAPDQAFYCWRVYANTQMVNAGVNLLDCEAILGHKSDRMQRAYTAENLVRYKKALDSIY